MRITIINASGNYALSKEITDIIEVLGAKVVLSQVAEEADFECELTGSPSKTGKVLSRLFSCNFTKDPQYQKKDLRLKIGRKFAERF